MQSNKKEIGFSHGFSYIFSLLLIILVSSCGLFGSGRGDKGEFKSAPRPSWYMEAPVGMVAVPGGSFMMGPVGEDIFGLNIPHRNATVSSFFMDQTEITNSDYRKFISVLLSKVQDGEVQDGEVDEEDQEEEDNKEDNEKVPKKDKYEEQLTLEFIMTELYPDSNVWKNDFSNNMADILLEGYYDHPAYDTYPVVGVSWEAAKIFTAWRTKYLNAYREEKGLPPYPSFSLPSAAQWEYAARGSQELVKYPWGGPYIRDQEGKLLANFKAGKGNYSECGYTYTSPVTAFEPNNFGLYDMAGNVSEWTLDSYNPIAVCRTWDLDPLYLDDTQPMKVIKGGSWKDISRFLQTGMVDYEHKDSARSYIGFRCVIPYIGAQDPNMFESTKKRPQ